MYNFYRRKYVEHLIMLMSFCLIDLSRVFFEPISVTQLTSEDHFYRNRNGTYFRQQKYKLKSILFFIHGSFRPTFIKYTQILEY